MSHGFVKDVKISKELAEFLKVPFDTTISRPKVTTAISQYVKEHDLANPEKKSIFKTDSVLEKILGEPRFLINKKRPELGMGFSYFNLQTYMKEHFLKD
jgi:chromatin remodeling complex protein RSC6